VNEILCLDAGSSSLKFAAYRVTKENDELTRFAAGEAPAVADSDEAFDHLLSQLAGKPTSVAAVGHRIVFGGSRYVAPTYADDRALRDLESFVAIEPLHMRAELDLVYAARRRLPNAAQVLCFDTAFHRSEPAIARRLPLPNDLDPLIERYGFHGLSYEYVASQLPPDSGRTVIAHLGSGASLCALQDRSPVDTTMGFSALGGLMMATRPGDLDPGVVVRLLADGYDLERLTDLLYKRSGLLGVSGTSADMRELLVRSGSEAAAREAVDLFVYQLAKHLGAMIAVLGGLKTLVFTGGIGEHAAAIRTAACAPLAYLGLRLDDEANRRNDRIISDPAGDVSVLVVPTDENLMVARHTAALLRTTIEKVP
jgi:acetate kinase